MSNHAGGLLVNQVLLSAKKAGFFESVSHKKKREFLKEVLDAAVWCQDCNPNEILQGLGAEFGTCSGCLKETDVLEDDLCVECKPCT